MYYHMLLQEGKLQRSYLVSDIITVLLCSHKPKHVYYDVQGHTCSVLIPFVKCFSHSFPLSWCKQCRRTAKSSPSSSQQSKGAVSLSWAGLQLKLRRAGQKYAPVSGEEKSEGKKKQVWNVQGSNLQCPCEFISVRFWQCWSDAVRSLCI